MGKSIISLVVEHKPLADETTAKRAVHGLAQTILKLERAYIEVAYVLADLDQMFAAIQPADALATVARYQIRQSERLLTRTLSTLNALSLAFNEPPKPDAPAQAS